MKDAILGTFPECPVGEEAIGGYLEDMPIKRGLGNSTGFDFDRNQPAGFLDQVIWFTGQTEKRVIKWFFYFTPATGVRINHPAGGQPGCAALVSGDPKQNQGDENKQGYQVKHENP